MATPKKNLTPQDITTILQEIDAFIVTLEKQWDQQAPPGSSWWLINRDRLVAGADFIIRAADKTILFVEDEIPAGTDKKAAVLLVATSLFNYILVPAFPIWLKPFIPSIQDVLINIMIGNLIDFIVEKYNQGIWKKDVNNAKTKFRK